MQVFRNGTIEVVDAKMLEMEIPIELAKHRCWHSGWEMQVCKAAGRAINLLVALGLALPCLVLVALTGVKGHAVVPPGVHHQPFPDYGYPFGRDCMLLPDVLIEDADVPPDVVLRPVFDAIWNEAGFPEDPYYDESGRHTDCLPQEAK